MSCNKEKLTRCPDCGEVMIHRDNRKYWESSSAFNAIIHREGPLKMTVADVDTLTGKFKNGQWCLRCLEHKQPEQSMGTMQLVILKELHRCLAHCSECPGFENNLHKLSGVYVIRGQVGDDKNKVVNFLGKQIITRVDDFMNLFRPTDRKELWDWLNLGSGWTERNNRYRISG